jgi:hypothetical protein
MVLAEIRSRPGQFTHACSKTRTEVYSDDQPGANDTHWIQVAEGNTITNDQAAAMFAAIREGG